MIRTAASLTLTALALASLQGCLAVAAVKTAGAVVGTTAEVAVRTTGAVVDVVTPDDDDKDEDEKAKSAKPDGQ